MTWTLDAAAAVPVWRPASDPGAVLAFSTRRGGASDPPYDTLNLGRSSEDRPEAVAENRRRLLAALDLDPGRVASAGQVHGTAVARVREPGSHPGCDALVTRVPGIALVVTTADCLPILYVAPGSVAAAHSGWRGTAAGMPVAALRALCDAGAAAPAEVAVHLGPCIRSCCYLVGSEVADRFPEPVRSRVDGAWHLDLVAATRRMLTQAGVLSERISEVPACTACNPSWYFSHRRDHGRTGRHWAIAALPA
jgi:hypothetical protein